MSNLDELLAKRAELDKQIAEAERAAEIAKGREAALSTIAKIAAFKELFGDLKTTEGVFGESWQNIAPQSLPKEATIARRYEVSETEAHNAKEKGRASVAKL